MPHVAIVCDDPTAAPGELAAHPRGEQDADDAERRGLGDRGEARIDGAHHAKAIREGSRRPLSRRNFCEQRNVALGGGQRRADPGVDSQITRV